MFLTDDEVRQFTRRLRPKCQARILKKLNVPHEFLGDAVIILRSVIEKRLGEKPTPAKRKTEPNFLALHGPVTHG